MMGRMLTVLAALEGGGTVSSKVCYHVALSGAGGKWGEVAGFLQVMRLGKRTWMWEWKGPVERRLEVS